MCKEIQAYLEGSGLPWRGGGCRGEEEGLGGGPHRELGEGCIAPLLCELQVLVLRSPHPLCPLPPPKIHPGMKEGAALLSPPSSPKPRWRDGGSGGGVQEQEDTSALRPQVNTGLKQLHGEKC